MAMLNSQRVYDVIRTIISCGFSRVPGSEDTRLVLKCYNLATCEATKKRAAWKPHMKTHGLWKMILIWIYIYIDKIRLYQVLWSSSAYLSLKHAQLLEIQTAKIICKNDDHIQSCNHCRAEFSDDAFFVRQTKSRPLAAAKTPPAASEASASRCLRSATVDVRHLKLGNYMKGIRNTL